MAENRKAARKLLKSLVRTRRYIVISPRGPARQARSVFSGFAKVDKNDLVINYSEVKKYLADLPSCEPWLQNNPDAKASVERGLEQATSNQGRYLGSFAKYADLEIEED